MKIKCLIWDLDNTIWNGNLKDNRNVQLKPEIKNILRELYERGVIQSIASKNYNIDAIKRLKELDIDRYFVFSQISYNPKSIMVEKIINLINVEEENVGFIDDNEFELNEVRKSFNKIKIYKAEEYTNLLLYPELKFEIISNDSKNRMEYLKLKERRIIDEENFNGAKEEFLHKVNTTIIVKKYRKEYIDRVRELICRTNKYNNRNKETIYNVDIIKYSKKNLNNILVFEMKDIYGSYGIIGTLLYKIENKKMMIDVFSISCRILGRGIAVAIFSRIINKLFDEDRINEVECKIKYTKKNRESIILFNLLNFELKNNKNDIIHYELKKCINVKNCGFINVIFEENI